MIRKLRKCLFPQEEGAKGEDENWDIVDGELIVDGKPILPSDDNGETVEKDKENLEPDIEVKEERVLSDVKGEQTDTIPQTLEEEKEIVLQGSSGSRGRPKKIDGFFQHLQAAERSPGTIQGYKKDLRFWEGVAKTNRKTIYALTVGDIEKAVLSKKSCRKRRLIAMLKSLAKYYLREGYPKLHIECQKIVLGKNKDSIPKAKDKKEFTRIREEAKTLCEVEDRRGVWFGVSKTPLIYSLVFGI